MANNPENQPDIANLVAAATDVPAAELAPNPYPRPQPNNFFWRSIDFIGRFAAPLGGLLAVLAFGVGVIGGPNFAWISFLYLGTIILFIIFIFAFLRKERREREAAYTANRLNQARLKAEIAKMLLEQQNQKND